jgi:NTE family protein
MDPRKTVSLVLGGGGARGAAHIGVIEWLVQNGYVIRSISGSSMGALIGGIYAASRLDLYSDWVTKLERRDVVRLLDIAFGRPGLFKGERVMALLRGMVGEWNIEDLPIVFTAVATDLETGKEVWLRRGPLFDAIRASIATPLVFTPFEWDGRHLVDGALVNPVPIAPTLNDATSLTVAVTLSARAEAALVAPSPAKVRSFINGFRKPRNPAVPSLGMIDVALASMDAMQNIIARLKLAAYSPDVTVEIPRNACGYHEFWRAREMITFGRDRTRQAFERAGRLSGAPDALVSDSVDRGTPSP